MYKLLIILGVWFVTILYVVLMNRHTDKKD